MPDRPSTVEEYVEWAKSELDHTFDDRHMHWYQIVVPNLRTAWERSPFAASLPDVLGDSSAKYERERGASLFAVAKPDLNWNTKPYSSVLDKVFRQNVVWNSKFPKPPKGGWLSPTDVLDRLDDVIRSRIVLRYLDGPEFLAERIQVFAEGLGLTCRYDSRELDEGYYAFHVYVTLETELVDLDFQPTIVSAQMELQLTTQLQDVLRELTHRFYEERRLEHRPDRKRWKWEHDSDRFRSAYLGHTLHLLEGLILDVRERSFDAEGDA